MYSLIIKNGTIIDGSGKTSYQGDLAIEGDKIVQIGDLEGAKAVEVIDASGQFVAPGFVDIQNHSDVYWTLFDNPSQDSLVLQGITSILVGNCGASLAPIVSPSSLLAVQKWHNLAGANINWVNFKEYLDVIQQRKLGVNVASLVGYSTLRRGFVGDSVRALTDSERRSLKHMLVEAISEGAFGLSSGLAYAHEANVSEKELLDVVSVLKEHDALFSVHLRSEGTELTESVAEALDLVYKHGINLKISHFKAKGKENWHLLPHALTQIEEAYHKRGKIHFDLYPYDFTWQVLYTYLPRWSYENGRTMLSEYLKDEVQRKKILDYLRSKELDYASIYIASTSVPLNIAGKTIGHVARRHNLSAEEMLLHIVEHGGSEILVFEKNISTKQVEELIHHPLSMIATDGAGFAYDKHEELVHARCFGAMPRFLRWVIDTKSLSLEKAVQKITSTPANKMGLKKRGVLAVDNFADVVVFGKDVASEANELNPHKRPVGINHVVVSGVRTVSDGKMTNVFGGKVLRK
jgi:N-acyl-D-amino-acid deacylase